MLQTILPVISECVIAFDLSLNQYVTIGPCIGMLAGHDNTQLPDHADFWYDIIHPADAPKVKQLHTNLTDGESADISYRIVPSESNSYRYITERRSKYTDAVTGHQIVLSILNEHAPSAINSENEAQAYALKREQFLLSLINSQTNFLIRLNKAGKYTFVNKAYCRAMGYTEDELLGAHFTLNTAPEDFAVCGAALMKCLASPGRIIPLIKDKIDKAGARHPSEWEFISVIDEKGEVTEVQGIGQDISQRVETERLVRQTNQKLDNFIESITDAFFILDNNRRFVRTNAALDNIAGRTRNQLTGASVSAIIPLIGGAVVETELKLAEEERLSRQFTLFQEQSARWIRITIYPSVEGLTVFVKDITGQKQAEAELNRTRANLESLINNTKDHIWSIDTSMRYMYTNVAYKEAVLAETGLTPTRGEPVVIFGTDDIRTRWSTYYQKALAGEHFDVVYEHLNSVTGFVQYYEVGFNPIYNTAGLVVGMGCFARNVTDHLKREKEVINQNERLRNIASITSHDLRRPVASMLGLINIIDFENFGSPDNKETISHLLTVGKEIDEVIRLIVDNAFNNKVV